MEAGTDCWGFHVAGGTACYLLLQSRRSWSEQDMGGVVLVMLRGGNPNCSAENFPHSRGRSRYRFERTKKTFGESSRACQSLGGKLVQITTEAERIFVWNIIKAAGVTSGLTLTGLWRDRSIADHRTGFRWQLSGDRLATEAFWREGDPNDNGGNQNAVALVNRHGQLNDKSPNDLFNYMCECLIV